MQIIADSFLGALVVKNQPVKEETWVRFPGSESSPGEGNGKTLLHSCLGNPMDRGDWWATVHGVTREGDVT